MMSKKGIHIVNAFLLYAENPTLGVGFNYAYSYTTEQKNSFWCRINLRSGTLQEHQKEDN